MKIESHNLEKGSLLLPAGCKVLDVNYKTVTLLVPFGEPDTWYRFTFFCEGDNTDGEYVGTSGSAHLFLTYSA